MKNTKLSRPRTAGHRVAPPTPAPLPETSGQFPVVGIGASAGGLAAFEAFFSGLPAETDPGMAFVLVQHLDPSHKSILTELIQRYTRMQVFEVEDGMKVHNNCVYIIPPNCDLAFLNGTLQILVPTAARGQRLPIDYFFQSLAQDLHERAIGIILSGTGSDGTLGVRAIKGEGGLVLAQKPESAEYDGMPRSVIATGLVDFELAPAEMPARIIAYVAHALSDPAVPVAPALLSKTGSAMKKAFVLLRAQTGHDFSQYKPSTIQRRIERRMAVHQIKRMDAYVAYLQQTPAEVEALFRDLLIGVTSFFRDPETFETLDNLVLPKLLAGRTANGVFRIWVPACSTGEEAYSLAMLLLEQMEHLKLGYRLQIFATDLDSRAIATARAGIYPASIATNLSPERLARFFVPEPGGSTYRVHKAIRDLIVFSEQDVIKDPPFSKVDLISCRNLLIYLSADLQKKLMPLFHYALNPGGFLFLGASETPGDPGDLFTTLDRKAKLYQRKEAAPGTYRALAPRSLPALPPLEAAGPPLAPVKLSPRELTEKCLLRQLVQAGALVNAQGDILYIHGRTGMYLELAPGEAGVNNILKTARQGLQRELAIALRKAVATGETVRHPELRVKTNGHFTVVNLTICPTASSPAANSLTPALYLVILEESAVKPEVGGQRSEVGQKAAKAGTDAARRITALTKELRAKEEYLQSTQEELETSTEELKSSNEEMQSMNEELQSSNEELETSKEELQSINEELATVNTELQAKVADLACANNDMTNLLAGTGIATVFVDQQLRILRFTPAATRMINLIQSDIGRPIGHLASNLASYTTLAADAKSVLDTLIPKEVEAQTPDGKWCIAHLIPYRTLDNVIEGVVITFVDINNYKKVEQAASRLAAMIASWDDCIIGEALDRTITAWSHGAELRFGYTASEMVGTSSLRLIPADRQAKETEILERIKQGERVAAFETSRQAKDGRLIPVSLTISPIKDAGGQVVGVSQVARDLSARASAGSAAGK